jgi:hypothetical protein
MDSKRIAVFAGVIGIFSTVAKFAPDMLLDGLFVSGLPSWLPTIGSVGQTATVYLYGIDIIGALLMIVLAVGFGYYAGQQLDLTYEYRRFSRAVVAGTTVPLIAAWIIGVGAFAFWTSSVFNLLIGTALLLRLFAAISLPVIVGIFAGAAIAHFSQVEHAPPEPDETSTDTTSTTG